MWAADQSTISPHGCTSAYFVAITVGLMFYEYNRLMGTRVRQITVQHSIYKPVSS